MSKFERIKIRSARAIRHMSPRHIVMASASRKAIQRFAEKVGLVYFGSVSHRYDEVKLIRGHTISATCIDDHYCVGSLRGYDITLLARNDIVVNPRTKKQERCHWMICTVDLHEAREIPHIFIGHKSRETIFEARYEQLHPIGVGSYIPYPPAFMSNYRVYAKPTYGLHVQHVISPQIAEIISSHFVGMNIEIEEGVLYLYSESKHPDGVLLEKMLSNGLWLAEQLDAASVPDNF